MLNSHTPQNEGVIPLAFNSLDDNVSLSVAWPTGELMKSAGEQVEVYGDSVVLPLTITANKNATGQIVLNDEMASM